MQFLAHYQDIKLEHVDYWRTVHADTINEAAKIAKRYARKGYRLTTVYQHEGKD